VRNVDEASEVKTSEGSNICLASLSRTYESALPYIRWAALTEAEVFLPKM
jgi:hypothetical protein